MPTAVFSHKQAGTAMEQEERTKAQEAPHRTGQDLTACGGLKPISVIVQGLRLRQPQLDILTAPQAGILGFPDPAVLAYAAEHDRILISHDKHTLPHHFAVFTAAGRQSPGIMLISRKMAIGQAIEALLLVWEASRHEEWRNLITHLPL